MKQLWKGLLMAGVLLAVLLPSAAAELPEEDFTYERIHQAILTHWNGEYPECVGGIWLNSEGGNRITVGLLDNEAGREEKETILALTEGVGPVDFVWQKYSYAELRAVQTALEPYLGDGTGALAIGVDQSENCVVIDVNTANPGADAFIAECMETYGDKVRVNGADEMVLIPVSGSGAETQEEPASDSRWYIWPICGVVVLLGGVGFVSQRKRKTV